MVHSKGQIVLIQSAEGFLPLVALKQRLRFGNRFVHGYGNEKLLVLGLDGKGRRARAVTELFGQNPKRNVTAVVMETLHRNLLPVGNKKLRRRGDSRVHVAPGAFRNLNLSVETAFRYGIIKTVLIALEYHTHLLAGYDKEFLQCAVARLAPPENLQKKDAVRFMILQKRQERRVIKETKRFLPVIAGQGHKPAHVRNRSFGRNQRGSAYGNPVRKRHFAAIRDKCDLSGNILTACNIVSADDILHGIVNADELRRSNFENPVIRADDSLHGNAGTVCDSDSAGLPAPHFGGKDKLLFGQNDAGKFVLNDTAGNLSDLLFHESSPFLKHTQKL